MRYWQKKTASPHSLTRAKFFSQRRRISKLVQANRRYAHIVARPPVHRVLDLALADPKDVMSRGVNEPQASIVVGLDTGAHERVEVRVRRQAHTGNVVLGVRRRVHMILGLRANRGDSSQPEDLCVDAEELFDVRSAERTAAYHHLEQVLECARQPVAVEDHEPRALHKDKQLKLKNGLCSPLALERSPLGTIWSCEHVIAPQPVLERAPRVDAVLQADIHELAHHRCCEYVPLVQMVKHEVPDLRWQQRACIRSHLAGIKFSRLVAKN